MFKCQLYWVFVLILIYYLNFQVWDNLRKNSKTEMHDYLHASRKTGQHNVPLPSETVQRVCFIFGFYGVGCSLIEEVGVYSTHKDAKDSEFSKLYEDKGKAIALYYIYEYVS